MKFSKAQLYKLKKALLKLSEIQTEEGVTLITDGDNELAVGVEVFVDGEEGLVPASDGDYNYNGQIITVEGGVITNIAEKPTEENTPEPETEETPVEENAEEEETPAEEEEKPADEVEGEITEEVVEVAEEINEEVNNEEEVDVEALKSKIAELEALVEELKAKLAEPVAESVEEEMKKQEKQNTKKPEMNYMAAIKKAREIQITRK